MKSLLVSVLAASVSGGLTADVVDCPNGVLPTGCEIAAAPTITDLENAIVDLQEECAGCRLVATQELFLSVGRCDAEEGDETITWRYTFMNVHLDDMTILESLLTMRVNEDYQVTGYILEDLDTVCTKEVSEEDAVKEWPVDVRDYQSVVRLDVRGGDSQPLLTLERKLEYEFPGGEDNNEPVSSTTESSSVDSSEDSDSTTNSVSTDDETSDLSSTSNSDHSSDSTSTADDDDVTPGSSSTDNEDIIGTDSSSSSTSDDEIRTTNPASALQNFAVGALVILVAAAL